MTMAPTTRPRYSEPTMPPPTMALPPPPQGPPPAEPPPPVPASSSLGRTSSSSTGARPSTRPAIAFSNGSRQAAPPTGTVHPSNRSRSSSIAQQQGYQLSPATLANGPSVSASGAAESSHSQLALGPSQPNSQGRPSSQGRSYSQSSHSATTPGAGPPPRTPSRTLLQQALTLAQQAVLLDQESQFVEALDVYRTTVGLLEKVMERVEAGERKRRERGQSASGSAGEEEGRTLRGIYDAYTSRIALLSEQLDAETPLSSPALSSGSHPYQHYPSSFASANRAPGQDSLAPAAMASNNHYRSEPSGAYDGIGTAMLSTSSSSASLASNSATVGAPIQAAATAAVPFHRPRPPSQLSLSSTHSRNQSYSNLDTLYPSSESGNRPRSNSRSLGPAPGPPPPGPPPPPPSTAGSSGTALSSHRTSLLSSVDGAEAGLRRQSLLDSLELSLGPATGRKVSSTGHLLEGVVETPEGSESVAPGRRSTDTMEVLNRTPLQPDFHPPERGREPPSDGNRARLGKTPVVLETSEGTISQRRKAGAGAPPDLYISGGSSMRGSSIDLDRDGVRTAPPEPSLSSSSASSSTPSPTPPLSDSQLSLPQPMTASAPKEKSGMFRLRALSQPGRRPSLASNGDGGQQTPPVPVIQRKASFPAQPLGSGGSSPGRSLAPFGIGRSGSSAGSAGATGSLRSTSARSAASSREAFDHYPPVPPSPSFSVNSSFTALGGGRSSAVRQTPVGTVANQSPTPETIPASLVHRPFHMMRLLRTTMVTPGGAYLTKRMHVSAETWTLAGVHLQAVDTKVEAIQQLADGLQAMERAGAPFLDRSGTPSAAAMPSKVLDQGRDWIRALDTFERAIDDVQVSLGKKLGMEFGGHVKAKSSGTSLMGFGNKLTRVMEKKFANGRNVNNVYVDDLSRLFAQVQFLDEHLKHFTTAGQPPSAAYLALAASARAHVEQRLRRVSEFFGQVVVVVVLRDLGLLMDKYAKSVDKWLMD